MIHATKIVNEGGLLFMHKKHLCPVCNQLLEVAYMEKMVNSHSPEAKDYDFSMPGCRGVLVGNVLFRIRCFYCTSCEKVFRVKQIKEIEKKLTTPGYNCECDQGVQRE